MQEALIKEIVKKVVDTLEGGKTIPIEVSARHVHLSENHIKELFGKDYKMSKKKDLSQPGQFQYNERVTLIGPKGVLKGVAILGPARDKTQVEISKTDAIALGINPPVRESGDLDGSEKIYIATEKTVIEANESVIIAKRHIHMTQEDAKRLGVKDKQLVRVRINSDRPVVLEDVVVRVNSRYRLSMHIDFDEANGAGYEDGTLGEMII
ncbi:phosphate propanoyltransferase [Paramaledivibacter caminithermalis]|uniref:Phosphate propanoyltransferase n=1 Tax=Paramaledivibacter caminithermalis (strain DSM 15212 / CIP 107654 / DViRD3) TaxID=1121301 RepID=A0A1M6PNJ6_PARC5|nr:phosphate propanoyltransferase [Paramaledivibacter caminithermalis]SHK09505.1 Propanediol utilization protein [Paramaledivibacter caminithermalis DSM 15212]